MIKLLPVEETKIKDCEYLLNGKRIVTLLPNIKKNNQLELVDMSVYFGHICDLPNPLFYEINEDDEELKNIFGNAIRNYKYDDSGYTRFFGEPEDDNVRTYKASKPKKNNRV